MGHRGQPRSAVRRLCARPLERQGRRGDRRPTQGPDQPAAWSLYIGTEDAAGLAERVQTAGGTVVAPAFDVGDQGKMAVFQDPSGAFISAWQADPDGRLRDPRRQHVRLGRAQRARRDRAIPFYREVFGWTPRTTGSGAQPYTEFQVDGESIAGATEMNPDAPGGHAQLLARLLRRRGRRRVVTAPRSTPAGGSWSRRTTSRAAGCRSSRIRRERRSAC